MSRRRMTAHTIRCVKNMPNSYKLIQIKSYWIFFFLVLFIIFLSAAFHILHKLFRLTFNIPLCNILFGVEKKNECEG